MAGLWFEEFEVGRRFTHEVRRTVTDMDNILFSALTYNPAAIHIDHAYAATTERGPSRGDIAPGQIRAPSAFKGVTVFSF